MNDRVLSKNQERFDVYASITQTIIAAIERGAGEFVMPWHRTMGSTARPTNAATEKPYRGVNVVALWSTSVIRGYAGGTWATFRQWLQLGAPVRRGEKGAPIIFYKPAGDQNVTTEVGEDDTRRRFIARASWVFNAEQVEGWEPEPAPAQPSPVERVQTVEHLVARTRAEVVVGGQDAYYAPALDRIHLPEVERFHGSPTRTPTEAFYATLLHELVHWTGAEHRLNRAFGKRFGDRAYAFEELVAELGAAFLCADVGLTAEPREDHAQYLSSWLSVLSSDNRAIVLASRLAAEAAAFIVESAP